MDSKVLAGIVVAVIAIAGVAIFMLQSPAEGRVIEVELGDFVFNLKGVDEPLRVKAGETIVFKITNKGTVEHEFMIVSEDMKEMMLQSAMQLFQDLQAQGYEGQELIEKFEEEFGHAEEEMEGGMLGEMILEPGESGELKVTFEEPGTYYIICLEVEGTGHAGKTHADMGMIFKVIVEG